jgi:hypothetical protein
MNNKLIDIDNIFFPSDYIKDPKWFAGRQHVIKQALDSLCNAGASMVVYGERGSGKTSFVEMIKLIAAGDTHLLYKFNFHKRYSIEKFKYKIISVSCNSYINNIKKVLQSLITSPYGIKSIISSKLDTIEKEEKSKFGLSIFKSLSLKIEESEKKSYSSIPEESVVELFNNLVHTISKDILRDDEGLLIVIDEFDLVNDSENISSIIKNLSSGNIKFLIAGISETYENLIKGHSSIARQMRFGRIEIKLMSDTEIKEVFSLVESNTNRKIRFELSFIMKVIETSSGYPYYVQLFGKLALEESFKENKDICIVHNQHLKTGIQKIRLYEYQMEADYLSIIKENPIKELIIKFISKQVSNKVKDDDVCTYCHKKGVNNPIPKNTLSSLLAHRDPQFLFREKERSDYLFFDNKLFKVFVHTRDPELLRVSGNDYEI